MARQRPHRARGTASSTAQANGDTGRPAPQAAQWQRVALVGEGSAWRWWRRQRVALVAQGLNDVAGTLGQSRAEQVKSIRAPCGA